jgi:hypothetical protein
MLRFVLLCCALTGVVAGQQPTTPVPDSTRPDSAKPDSGPVPLTPDQERYKQGLATAGRGIAQLKSGIDGVVRWQASGDTARLHQAGQKLAFFCESARGFISQGLPRMNPTAFADSGRLHAKNLRAQIDTLVAYIPTCRQWAGHTPGRTAATLLDRLRAYETALRPVRTDLGLPNKPVNP